MIVNFKKLVNYAVLPVQNEGNAGMDMTAISSSVTDNFIEYDTGIAVEIPEGYVGLLFPRSSISNTSLVLANSVGVIDSSYRGPIKFRFKKIINKSNIYTVGERVGQLVIMPYPKIESVEVPELSETERGAGGFGSSGK